MGKKKKKKKSQKSIAQELPPEQLIEKGKQFLTEEKARDAIGVLKTAVKTLGKSEEITSLLFRAYLMREEQLRKKNLIVEADVVRKQALEYMPKTETLSEKDMKAYLRMCSDEEAFKSYEQYMTANTGFPEAERILANRMFQNDCWELAEKLDETSPLNRDALTVRHAVSLMNAAKWEESLESLQSVPISSPFAPIRMFCRAMTAFYAEDDKNAFKALSMIPDEFPLRRVVSNLKRVLENGADLSEKSKAMSKIPCLWEGILNPEAEVETFFYHLRHRKFRQAKEFIRDFADMLYPQDPVTARSFMLEILWTMILDGSIDERELENLTTALLPEDEAQLLLTKTELLRFKKPFTMAGKYISLLEKEFPDPETRKIAHGFILQDTVQKAHEFGEQLSLRLDKEGIRKYGKMLGIRSDTIELMMIEMLVKSIELDPNHRKGYELLVALPRKSRPARQVIESALLSMADRFPDDPFPCLELAALYYETNAFRKAENILENAMKRAPHDNQVIERHILALLISVEKNIKRKKFHLVTRDIARAAELESKKSLLVIIEKKLLIHLLGNGTENADQSDIKKDLPGILEKQLSPLSPLEQLRVLAFLIIDTDKRKFENKSLIIKGIEKYITQQIKTIKTVSAPEVIKLLKPLGKEYAAIIPSRNIASIVLNKWGDILRFADDAEIIAVYDLILEPNLYKIIKKDIRQRMKKAIKNHRLMLEFYEVAIDHLTGKIDDPEAFEYIIDQANPAMQEELRGVSRRLSKHATGPLKKAFELFDFEILDDIFPFGEFDEMDDMFPPDDMGGGIDKFLDMIEMLDPNINMSDDLPIDDMIQEFEDFVDDSGVRGAPDFIIRDLRGMIRNDPKMRREFELMSKLIERTGQAHRLSREARIMLFGKK